MKIYLISVAICFLLFIKVNFDAVMKEEGCKKQPIGEIGYLKMELDAEDM